MKALILAFLLRLPIFGEDISDARKPEQLETVADAVARVADGDRRMAALLVSTGHVETGYSLRIHDGRCASWECDHGRARGPWQVWKNSMSAKSWANMRGIEHTEAQATAAREILLAGLKRCGTVRGALARYVGLPCDARGPLLDKRFDWYRRAFRALRKDDAA